MGVEHLKSLMGLPVFTLPEPDQAKKAELPAADAVAWRVDSGWEEDETFLRMWEWFLDSVDPAGVRALVVGPWWSGEYDGLRPALELLVAAKDRLTGLRALFLADVIGEECEVSWLQLTDVTPVLEAFPGLEELGVRGGDSQGIGEEELSLRPVRHEALRTLRFESGGLPAGVVRAVGESGLPALEHLELWLGVEQYGGNATVGDLGPLLSAGRFPRLRHLGLQNSELQDEIAAAVASAPVVAQLTSLSLSMGTLTDDGAEALLNGQPLTHLDRLDLRHHFLSTAMAQRLKSALEPGGVDVDVREQVEPHRWEDEEWRYVAVSE